MKYALLLIVIAISCKKSDDTTVDQSPEGILKRNLWVPHQTRRIDITDSTGAITKDTIIFPEACAKQEWIALYPEGKAVKNVVCMGTTPKTQPGTWLLKADSSFYVNIPIYTTGPGIGAGQISYGIGPSKLVSISETEFTVKAVHTWYAPNGSGGTYSWTKVFYHTYRKK